MIHKKGYHQKGSWSSAGSKISSISDTSKCTFIKNDYVDTMRPSKKFYFVQVRTHKAGGDAYKILSTNDEAVPGLLNSRTYLVHFEIWKCKNDETKVEN